MLVHHSIGIMFNDSFPQIKTKKKSLPGHPACVNYNQRNSLLKKMEQIYRVRNNAHIMLQQARFICMVLCRL